MTNSDDGPLNGRDAQRSLVDQLAQAYPYISDARLVIADATPLDIADLRTDVPVRQFWHAVVHQLAVGGTLAEFVKGRAADPALDGIDQLKRLAALPPSAWVPRVAVNRRSQPTMPPHRAVDVSLGRQRVVDVAQRLTLDRVFDVAVVESSPFPVERLRQAEYLMAAASNGQRRQRIWEVVDADDATHRIEHLVRHDDDLLGTGGQSAMVIDAADMDAGAMNTMLDVHREVCRRTRLVPGAVVFHGTTATVGGTDAVRLLDDGRDDDESPRVEAELSAAVADGNWTFALDHRHRAVMVLAALRASGHAPGVYRDFAAAILASAPHSVRRAWDVLEDDRVADPAAWLGATREFVALILRSAPDAAIPFSRLDRQLLGEDFFWDEVLRMSPRGPTYTALVALPYSIRRQFRLVGDEPDTRNLSNQPGGEASF